MPARIFLLVSFVFLFACSGDIPLVTIHQLDTVNNKSNPLKITKYNMETCKLEGVSQDSIELLGPELHGAFCLTKEDFAKYKAHFQAECKNMNEQKRSNEY